IARHLAECDARLDQLLDERSGQAVDIGKLPRAGSKARAEHDIRQRLANWAGVDLTRINGLGVTVVMKLLTEIGPDVSRFATVKHFCSWLGLCPGTKISGGKVLSSGTKRSANRVRQALKPATLRGAAAPTQHRRAQASGRRARIPDQPCGDGCMNDRLQFCFL
ncbi:MAG: hypothetical protein RLZZ373_3396, partial [Pseudomonadota bacterium]